MAQQLRNQNAQKGREYQPFQNIVNNISKQKDTLDVFQQQYQEKQFNDANNFALDYLTPNTKQLQNVTMLKSLNLILDAWTKIK
jgi:hypothetical protein